ncbi:MAG: hypothetical protein QOJ16_2075 [Acidobacteriota bacterium]|nr:hypothetical protein [Acidobacteriota bacterium]
MLRLLARPLARSLAGLALAACLGCASGGAVSSVNMGSAGSAVSARSEGTPPLAARRQVMVTLAPAPLTLWSLATRDLASLYDLRIVYAWSLGSLGERCIVFEIRKNGRSPEDVIRRLARDPRVRSAEAIQTFEVLADVPRRSDPYAHLQRGAHTLGLDQAHRWATGKGVKVAVIDTGVDLDHPDLRGRIAKANNFVDRGEQSFTSDIHGTAVAGVLAAGAGNEVGIAGTAPEAEIFALKACWPQPPGSRQAVCDSYTLAKAIDFAILEHAQILNFSLSGPPDPLLGRLVKAALDRGITVVAAAPDGRASGFPAALGGVIAVLGSDQDGNLRSPLASPHEPMLAAPGVDILTTVPHGSYDFFTGSSLAAAEVSGIAALLLERNAKLTPAQLAALIRKTARPMHLPGGEADATVSLVDACAAVGQVVSGVTCP